MPNPYYQPLVASFSAVPMYAGDQGPRQSGMFNFDTGSDPLNMVMQLGGQHFLSGMMAKNGMQPAQFFPTQNYHDQLIANQYAAQQQRAMQVASARDRALFEDVIGGGMRLMTGAPLGAEQRQQAFGMSQQIAGVMPLLAQVLGPDMIDALHGSQGSATVMAQAIHRGSRLSRDPVTGARGASGDSAGIIAQEVYEKLFGRGADVAAMKGLSAGRAGLLFEELQARGLGTTPLGMLSPTERLTTVGNMELTDAQVSRLAEQTGAISDIRAKGRDPTRDDFDKAERQIRETHQKIREGTARPGDDLDLAALTELPGAQDMLRTADAQRMTDRIKNLSGAVSAMRDIFGDMGRPNAPMRELINGLEALTQGGLASMSPAQLEQMARTTSVLAKQTGVGLQTMVGLTAQAAGMADRLGLDRSLAVQATQGAVAYGAAAAETQRLDIPAFGSLSKEQVTLLDQQLRMGAAASPTANQLNATIRAYEEGLIKPDSEAGRLAQAIKAGQMQYNPTGVKGAAMKPVVPSPGKWRQLMVAGGMDADTVENIYSDKFASQEYGRNFQTQGLTRRLQLQEDIQPLVATAFSNVLTRQLRSRGVEKVFRDQLGVGDDELSTITRGMGADLSRQAFEMKPEEYRDIPTRNRVMAQQVKATVENAVRARGGSEKDVDEALKALSERGATEIAVSAHAAVGGMLERDKRFQGIPSFTGLLQLHNQRTAEAQQIQMAEADTNVAMTTAMAVLGRTDPIPRAVDALRRAKPGDSIEKVLMEAVGGIATKDLDEVLPQIQALAASQARFLAPERTATGALTEAGRQQQTRETGITHGLLHGGAVATQRLEELAKVRGVLPAELDATIKTALDAVDSDVTLTTPAQKTAKRKQLEGELLDVRGLRAAQEMSLVKFYKDTGRIVTKLGADDVMKLLHEGETAAELSRDLQETSKPAEREDARKYLAGFLRSSRQLTEEFIISPEDMQNLGSGSPALIGALETREQAIQDLAKQEELTPEELLDPSGKGSSAAKAKARELYRGLQTDWETVRKRQVGEVRTDKMTEREKQAVTEDAAFRYTRFAEAVAKAKPEEQTKIRQDLAAKDVTERLIKAAPEADRDKLSKEVLQGIVSQGDLTPFRVQQALRGREQLIALAAKHKLLKHDGEVTDKSGDATESEKEAAITELLRSRKTLDPDERRDVDRMATESELLRGWGSERGTGDRLKQLRQFQDAPEEKTPTGAKADPARDKLSRDTSSRRSSGWATIPAAIAGFLAREFAPDSETSITRDTALDDYGLKRGPLGRQPPATVSAEREQSRKLVVSGRLKLDGLNEVLMNAQMDEASVEFNNVVTHGQV